MGALPSRRRQGQRRRRRAVLLAQGERPLAPAGPSSPGRLARESHAPLPAPQASLALCLESELELHELAPKEYGRQLTARISGCRTWQDLQPLLAVCSRCGDAINLSSGFSTLSRLQRTRKLDSAQAAAVRAALAQLIERARGMMFDFDAQVSGVVPAARRPSLARRCQTLGCSCTRGRGRGLPRRAPPLQPRLSPSPPGITRTHPPTHACRACPAWPPRWRASTTRTRPSCRT